MHARNAQSNRYLLVTQLLVFSMVLTGCSGLAGPRPAGGTPAGTATVDPLARTQAAATIIAELTRSAPATAEQQVLPTNTPAEEQLPPTSTPLPTNTPLPTDTPLPTNTPLPTATAIPLESPTATTPPTPAEPPWQLSFNDDFTAARFWPDETGGTFRLNYAGGGYSIRSEVVGDIIFSTRTTELAGVRLEVTASRKSGALDAYFGVICNFTNGGNYYMFAVGPDGWYGIVKKQMGKIYFLTEGIDQTGTVKTGSSPNTLRGDCYDGQLVLSVNGVQLAAVRDVSFTSGSVGMGVGTRNFGQSEVLFDDFFLYTLKESPAGPVPTGGPTATSSQPAQPIQATSEALPATSTPFASPSIPTVAVTP